MRPPSLESETDAYLRIRPRNPSPESLEHGRGLRGVHMSHPLMPSCLGGNQHGPIPHNRVSAHVVHSKYLWYR